MRNRLGHVVIALIIASILNLAIAWLCAYYSIPSYRGSVVISSDEFERGTELLNERDHLFAVITWTSFGVRELDCSGPWYIREHYVISEYGVVPQAYAYAKQFDSSFDENDHEPEEQYIFHRLIFDYMNKRITRIDAGWPMHSFRGFTNSDVNKLT